VCLVPLAAISTRGALRNLGRQRWVRLHRLVYPSAAAAVVHFFRLVKAELAEPLLYAALLAGLLLVRLVPLPRWL
jgi:methionine sulfoxide reductase heme-binding subunit